MADRSIHDDLGAELIHMQRDKLNHLSTHLRIRDRSVKEKFEQEYPDLISQKMRTALRKVS